MISLICLQITAGIVLFDHMKKGDVLKQQIKDMKLYTYDPHAIWSIASPVNSSTLQNKANELL